MPGNDVSLLLGTVSLLDGRLLLQVVASLLLIDGFQDLAESRLPYLPRKTGYFFLPGDQVMRAWIGCYTDRAEQLLLLLDAEGRTATSQFLHTNFVLLVLDNHNLQIVKVVSE